MVRDEQPQQSPPAYWPARPQVPARRRTLQELLLHPITLVVVAAAVGMFLGSQTVGVAQRYAKLLVGLAFLFVVFRYPSYVGVGVFLLFFGFPARIQIGDTNMIFIVVLAVVWWVRSGLGREPRANRTALDWAILAYLAVLVLSFVNVQDRLLFAYSYRAALHLAVPIIFYYTMVHVGRTERKLLFLSRMFSLTIALLFFTAFMERFASGFQFIPRWYVSTLGAHSTFVEGDKGRISGIMTHAIMGDLAAIACTHQTYMAVRAGRRSLWRYVHGLIALASVYVLSLTVNRGALLALAVGLILFLWVFSREVSGKRAIVGLVVMGGALFATETLGRIRGDVTLLSRMAGTRFAHGIPDTRQGVWDDIWRKSIGRPFLGHGPYYDPVPTIPGEKSRWPHNALLYYFYTGGIPMVATYLAIVWGVIRRTWLGRGLRIGEAPLSQGLTAVYGITVIQFMVGQMRSDHQRPDVFVYLMWILFAFGILARRIWDDQKKRPAPSAEAAPRVAADPA